MTDYRRGIEWVCYPFSRATGCSPIGVPGAMGSQSGPFGSGPGHGAGIMGMKLSWFRSPCSTVWNISDHSHDQDTVYRMFSSTTATVHSLLLRVVLKVRHVEAESSLWILWLFTFHPRISSCICPGKGDFGKLYPVRVRHISCFQGSF